MGSDIKQTIYTLEMHQEMVVSSTQNVQRVPGGWLYKEFTATQLMRPDGYIHWGDYSLHTVTFVPYIKLSDEHYPKIH